MVATVAGVRRLLAVDATVDETFVDRLRSAWEAGDAVLPLDPRLPPAARAQLLADLRPGDGVDAGDALVVATSGTTGRAKGVVLTHDAVAASAGATSARLGVEPDDDTWLCCLPVAHVGGLSVVTRALLTGTGLVMGDVDRPGATLVSLVATQLRRVDPARWRTIVLGGSAPPGDVPGNVVATYGLTESGSGCVYDGVPLDGVEVRIDPGNVVALRAPMLLRAYRSFDGDEDPKDADGWLRTGDAGELGPDGRLRVLGRVDDVIVTGGEKVWPDAVEAALRGVPGVADVAVVGCPDEEWGQRVVAVIVPAPTAAGRPALAELRGAVKEVLPAWCAPKEVTLVAALPRTSVGKVRRAEVRRLLAESAPAPESGDDGGQQGAAVDHQRGAGHP